jgi:hypothetical protein
MPRGGHNRLNLTGRRFGRLVVASYAETRGRKAYWNCDCDCGSSKPIAGTSLVQCVAQSCGCLRQEMTAEKNTKHGLAKRTGKGRWYIVWNSMMARCYSEKSASYYLYGGRGVKVCAEWQDAAKFVAWCEAQEPVARDMSIDRYPDTNGDYEPGNCRFATHAEQVRNRRMSVWATINGERLVLKDAVKKYGVVGYGCAKERVRLRGWSPEDAVLVKGHSIVNRRSA